MSILRAGWYILLYHNVSWEENCYQRAIRGTCPPDIFRAHLRALSSSGDLVSIAEAERRIAAGSVDGPMFSLWFDDGLAGLYTYAKPILEDCGLTAALAICSRFVEGTEFPWSSKLAYLHAIDGLRFLRTRLKKRGFRPGDSVKHFTRSMFSKEILQDIDEVFVEFTTPAQRGDLRRMFLDLPEIKKLAQAGWSIANHTCAHYAVSPHYGPEMINDDFVDCENWIEKHINIATKYWVLPYGVGNEEEVAQATRKQRGDRTLVFVGNKLNPLARGQGCDVLYRFDAPIAPADRLMDMLRRA